MPRDAFVVVDEANDNLDDEAPNVDGGPLAKCFLVVMALLLIVSSGRGVPPVLFVLLQSSHWPSLSSRVRSMMFSLALASFMAVLFLLKMFETIDCSCCDFMRRTNK